MRPSVKLAVNNKLNLSDFSLSNYNDIDSIDFYCFPKHPVAAQVFLCLKDLGTGLTEIIKLKETIDSYGKKVLRVPLTYSLRIKKATVEMKLFILDMNSDLGYYTEPVKIQLSTENYKLARETAMIRELSDSVVTYYEAIIKVLQEIIKKGDNAE